MSNETKELIEELKVIRLGLFRSAANLDQFISKLEVGLDDPAGPEYDKMYARQQQAFREDLTRILEYDKLIMKEKEIWQKIVDSL